MITPREVLVTSTSHVEGVKINKYLKPVSAHVVAGTNVFSDFAASVSDFFGGRSESYQKQLASIYDEAIERIKINAFEVGANCVLGLSVDIDEISGKNKAMFMITAVGTAVILESTNQFQSTASKDQKFDRVSVDQIKKLKQKKTIIEDSKEDHWDIKEETWDFIIANKVEEVLPGLLRKYLFLINNFEEAKLFYKRLVSFVGCLPDSKKYELIYGHLISENNGKVINCLYDLISNLELLDLKKVEELLLNTDFNIQKRGLQILYSNKSFYNGNDLIELDHIKQLISIVFKERCTRTTKKQLLSSKEKEIWICNCGESNDDNWDYCYKCNKDSYGFTKNELNPIGAMKLIDRRVELISELLG